MNRSRIRILLVPLGCLALLVSTLLIRNLLPARAAAAGGLSVSVGYAEDKHQSSLSPAAFPVPWSGSPNTIFLGNPVFGSNQCGTLLSCYDTGAIRLDNPGVSDILVSSVSVDDHSSIVGGKVFNLWGSFTVPAGKSVILTENPPNNNPLSDNFDTSGFPKGNCTPITVAPTVTITIGGVPTTLVDSTHVLDTGGIDQESCSVQQNEAIQWRHIGTTGVKTASLKLSPATGNLSVGQQATETATLLDGGGIGLPNANVTFTVTSGPDAGQTGTAPTDQAGQASFTYTNTAAGTDTVVASVRTATTVGPLLSNQTSVSFSNQGLGGPISPTWYFSEGRAGGGYNEWLTLENPNSTLCTVTIQYLAQPDSGAPFTKSVSVTLNPTSRVTRAVDGDLGTSVTGPGIDDAAIVSVNTAATPNCGGIVAERPLYFNALGTSSGSDVIGMTHLGTTFYFADLAQGSQSGGSYSSFITVLNPPGNQTATVTAKYYAGGFMISSQQINVAGGTRGTINPASASPALPARVAVVVTSNQPVAVERSSYFSKIAAGAAGTVSGGADVVGAKGLSNDWLFAEGYTGSGFQENIVISNVDPANAAASVSITLETTTGVTHTYALSVNPKSQVVWNVNAAQPNQNLSAEITSTGAKIVVEREMFFHYSYNGLSAIGGTDVLGQLGPASATNYGFAEGYTYSGYNEWLTLQNPTGTAETITIFLVNEAGGSYTTSVQVNAHTRATEDITAMVKSHLAPAGSTNPAYYEVSMVVKSPGGPFVAERPIYWNASGTQGGSDVIGYVGG